MPAPTSSAKELTIRFPSAPGTEAYKLLELPKELCKLLEDASKGGAASSATLTIKGRPSDDAVLCTPSATYALRQVSHSNSLILLSASDDDDNVLEIRDEFDAIFEAMPVPPRLERLDALLGEAVYSGEDEEQINSGRPLKRRRFNRAQLESVVQASETELDEGLKSRRIVSLDGEFRPLSQSHLSNLLDALLTTLTLLDAPSSPSDFPVDEVLDALVDEHDFRREVALIALGWFGRPLVGEEAEGRQGRWSLDVEEVVREVGLGVLRGYETEVKQSDFLSSWRSKLPDTFHPHVALPLLSGQYLPTPPSSLSYFPLSALSPTPAERFAELFLVRAKWYAGEMLPFLADLGDAKEREKLVLKFCRSLKDEEGKEMWTARMKY